MVFDPFGDFATKGYLRNVVGAKNSKQVKDLEYSSFAGNVEEAAKMLSSAKELTPEHVKKTHEILFSDVYPWAGKDRQETSPDLAITKGSVSFSYPENIDPLLTHAFNLGNTPEKMRENVGSVLGALADAHPFLDGNGRTIMTVHNEMTRRAGFHLDWMATNKEDYLQALTDEIAAPERGHLDNYLKPFVREGSLSIERISEQLTNLRGLNTEPDNSKPILTIISHTGQLNTDNLPQSDQEISQNLEIKNSFAIGAEIDNSNIKNTLDIIKKAQDQGFETELRVLEPDRANFDNVATAVNAADKATMEVITPAKELRQVAVLTKQTTEFKQAPDWATDLAIQSSKKLAAGKVDADNQPSNSQENSRDVKEVASERIHLSLIEKGFKAEDIKLAIKSMVESNEQGANIAKNEQQEQSSAKSTKVEQEPQKPSRRR